MWDLDTTSLLVLDCKWRLSIYRLETKFKGDIFGFGGLNDANPNIPARIPA